MLESFLIIINQVGVLFILIAIGFLLRKVNLLEEKGVKGITNVVLYAVTPCVIIRSFDREMNTELLKGLMLTFAVAIASYIFIIILTNFIVRDKDDSRRRIYRFAIIFSNTGFMGIPIYQAVLGDIGVFYGSAYIAMFNVFSWTYGYMMMDRESKGFDLKKAIVNPGVLSTIIGVIIFVAGIKLPSFLLTPMADMAALNTPLPMLVIGYFLAGIALKDFKDSKQYYIIACKLVIVPVIVIALTYLFGVRGDVFLICAIAVSTPCATSTTMFSEKFGRDAMLASRVVSLSTLLSIVTMPIIISVAQVIAYR